MRRRRARVSGAGRFMHASCLPVHSLNYTFRPPKAGEAIIVPQQAPSSILLIGDPSVRPEGLERLLVRAGFQVTEAPHGTPIARPVTPPHIILYSVGAPD